MQDLKESLTIKSIAALMLSGLDRVEYVRTLGFDPFPWQMAVLSSSGRRIIINAARQSGKSTIVSAIPCHKAKYKSGSLSIILAATEKQAVEDMEKVKGFINCDKTYPKVARSSDSLLKLDNGSRIVVVPATDKAARGYSKPDVVIIDEASRVEDIVYTSGVKAMFTDNPGQLILLSTPNGKNGFFHSIFSRRVKDDPWERYEICSPWEPASGMDGLILNPRRREDKYAAERAADGIRAWYSPRHRDYSEQLENLRDMGTRQYKQEYCCEFVETEASVFSYAEIDAMFSNCVAVRSAGIQTAARRTNVDFACLEG